MKNKLLKYIYNFTYKCMKFLMDNNYPIEYDSDYICADDLLECYCPIHKQAVNNFHMKKIKEGDN